MSSIFLSGWNDMSFRGLTFKYTQLITYTMYMLSAMSTP